MAACGGNNTSSSCSCVLTTEPHDELHLGRDLVLAEVVCEERQRVDVSSSASQHQHLITHTHTYTPVSYTHLTLPTKRIV